MRQQIVQRLGFRQEIRILLAGREAQDGAEVAAQHDGQFATLRHQRHLVDQRAQDFRRLRAAVLVPQVLGKLGDALGIERRHVRVQQGWRLVRIGQLLRQLCLAGFQLCDLVLERQRRDALQDGVDGLVEFAGRAIQAPACDLEIGAALHAQPVHLPGELGAELPEQLRLHQVLAQAVQDRGLERVAADVDAIVAGALVARRRAAQEILRDHRIAAAAAAAFDQAGEKVLRAAAVVQRIACLPAAGREGEFALPRLHRVPERLIDDAQIRHLLHHPFAFRIQPRHPPAGIGILDVAQPVPDQPADIEFVVEDAGAAFAIAMNRRRPPFPALGTEYALAVQRHGDGARGEAGVIVGEDAADHGGLSLVDRAVPPDRFAVGV
ncbi:hypothetical protein IT40_20585 [Paracoccus versutus]|nr:hypothetical protein IT40_20585 [Paracoccus versutus]